MVYHQLYISLPTGQRQDNLKSRCDLGCLVQLCLVNEKVQIRPANISLTLVFHLLTVHRRELEFAGVWLMTWFQGQICEPQRGQWRDVSLAGCLIWQVLGKSIRGYRVLSLFQTADMQCRAQALTHLRDCEEFIQVNTWPKYQHTLIYSALLCLVILYHIRI